MTSQTESRSPVVAIDGPAGSGKSTAAKLVAARLGYTLLDSGAIYRSLALAAQEQGISWEDGAALAGLAGRLDLRFELQEGDNRVLLGDRDVSGVIRTPEVSAGASRISAIGEVRDALLDLQRRFAERGPVVAEGRDMGTVVFPRAKLKVFLDASAEERARRRHAELVEMGHEIPFQEVLDQQVARDRADSERDVAPLKPAADAVALDTPGMTLEQVVQRIVELAG